MMRMANTGQYCDGLKRLIVHESKLDEVLDARAEGPDGVLEAPEIVFRVIPLAAEVESPALVLVACQVEIEDIGGGADGPVLGYLPA